MSPLDPLDPQTVKAPYSLNKCGDRACLVLHTAKLKVNSYKEISSDFQIKNGLLEWVSFLIEETILTQ